jgi:uncharacterized protein (TIGR02145 family)
LTYSGKKGAQILQKETSNTSGFAYEPGDNLLYVGIIGGIESGLTDAPVESKQYTFQFSANVPCPGMPSITYEGKVYHTVQIFSQCWLKENLDVGQRIDGNIWMTNNGIIEKYCYDNNPDSCDKYGGLYQWTEAMNYNTQEEGTQGICPPGWHIPTEEEWKILEGAVDSEFRIGDNEWFIFQFRGFDAGNHLRSASGWINNWNGSDTYGWTALGAGYLWDNGYQFIYVGEDAWWWTSSSPPTPWIRRMNPYGNGVYRHIKGSNNGLSVRCLKDL